MTDLESVRKEITRLQAENAKLTTKIVRNRKVIAQKEETYIKVQDIANEQETFDSDSTQASFKIKQLPSGMDKVRELYKTVCQCGDAAKFNGFCENCVKKMKEDYEKALNDYLPVSVQYEKVYSNNVNKEVKMLSIKNKIDSMREKIKEGDISFQDGDLKILQDEIDYLRKQIKVTQMDYEVQQKEFTRYVEEQNKVQEDLEMRLAKKEDKIQKIKEQIDLLLLKNKKIEENIGFAKEELESYVK
ncbi:unnamed protein product (macronuclear) [Paramecium tetraurelia]|uniref:Uncharacterized protein n=1 Tax=Paramecium tetraurelia TaxID=5888 RepID=A0CGH8_PARTE|nr:uncharacterized protein GSPATT00007335001 [Paramecium tetraurelia]CAK69895.1 unnamed protein product [Paramecium tetraurelia]|eukprot:XP_001437292.1 hypothetical protein (macronuclear) [Paramecium tetraurelia strain d4-2]